MTRTAPRIVVALGIALTLCCGCRVFHIKELEQSNARLTSQLAESRNQVAALEQRVIAVESGWSRFERSYDPSTREELQQNLEAVRVTLEQLVREADASKSILLSLSQLESEAKRLKDLCAMHAAEANDADQINDLKASIDCLERNITQLECKTGQIDLLKSQMGHVESSTGFLRMDVSNLRSEVSHLRSKIK